MKQLNACCLCSTHILVSSALAKASGDWSVRQRIEVEITKRGQMYEKNYVYKK